MIMDVSWNISGHKAVKPLLLLAARVHPIQIHPRGSILEDCIHYINLHTCTPLLFKWLLLKEQERDHIGQTKPKLRQCKDVLYCITSIALS